MTALDDDALAAAAHLVGRSGAREFEVGYQNDDGPADEADWYAVAKYRGSRVIVEHFTGPVEAAEALARRLLTGATCRCGKLVALSDRGAVAFTEAISPFPGVTPLDADVARVAGQCRWTRKGPRWEPGCDAPLIKIRGN